MSLQRSRRHWWNQMWKDSLVKIVTTILLHSPRVWSLHVLQVAIPSGLFTIPKHTKTAGSWSFRWPWTCSLAFVLKLKKVTCLTFRVGCWKVWRRRLLCQILRMRTFPCFFGHIKQPNGILHGFKSGGGLTQLRSFTTLVMVISSSVKTTMKKSDLAALASLLQNKAYVAYVYYIYIYTYIQAYTLRPLCGYHFSTRRRRQIPKMNCEDEFPEDEFPPEDECRRRIPRRRIVPRRRIPKTNSPKTNCDPKTNFRRRIAARRRIPLRKGILKTSFAHFSIFSIWVLKQKKKFQYVIRQRCGISLETPLSIQRFLC